jgi:hypothetical protein
VKKKKVSPLKSKKKVILCSSLNFCGEMSDYSDLDRQIETLKRCEIIKENEVKALCAKAREILVEEGNVQRVDSPVTVSIVLFSLHCERLL